MGADDVVIRAARRSEAAALTELALRSKAVWGYDAAFMERCRPILTVSPAYIDAQPIFVAERDGRVTGFYSLRGRGESIELDLLFVEPSAIRGGTGSRLLAHALREAAALGHDEMLVESDPWAEGFYLRAGAVRVGHVPSTLEEGRMLPLLAFRLREVASAPAK